MVGVVWVWLRETSPRPRPQPSVLGTRFESCGLQNGAQRPSRAEDSASEIRLYRSRKKMAVAPTTVEFQATYDLQFGGMWISSDFYSHSGGYRLCLVLKSTNIERPTNERRVAKPTLLVAVLAIDDGTDRQWPCEGTATMRFEPPVNDHLLGEELSPSFLVKFSIGEPVTNFQLKVLKLEGNLPAGLVRSWTNIPQECIPFYVKFKVFDPNTQYGTILTSNNSSITVKIENIQVFP